MRIIENAVVIDGGDPITREKTWADNNICTQINEKTQELINGGKHVVITGFVFGDEGERIDNEKCSKCNKQRTEEGYDACLGYLPGVKNACCGHGEEGYIQFENGTILRFDLKGVDK